MKFQSLFAFEKHLKEAFPSHFSRFYGVVCSSDYERKSIMRNLSQLVQKKEPACSLISTDASLMQAQEVIAQLQSPSLFSPCILMLVDEIEKWKKPALEMLALYLERPSSQTYLILGSSSSKGLSEIYTKAKKEMVVLDLNEEKPWDKQKRLKEWILAEGRKEKKNLMPDVADYLLQEVGPDLALLEQELQKLLCFCMERSAITLADAKTLLSARATETSWQIAEGVIFAKKGLEGPQQKDLSFLLPLAGQIRYHLQMGFKITSLLENGVSTSELSQHIPNFKAQQLDKYRGKPSHFYRRGLELLFHWELKCKSSSLDAALLFDHFTFHLHAASPS